MKKLKLLLRTLLQLPEKRNIDFLKSYLSTLHQIQFIQIGSNDGKTGDPLRIHIYANNWKGLLIEPVPYIFKKLQSNYEEINDRVFFENAAVTNTKESLTFYRLEETKDNQLPEWYDQLGTFDKKTIFKHRNEIRNFEDRLIEESVKTISFNEINTNYPWLSPQLIHIDTEGYDYEILKSIPFNTFKLSTILFEHKHLSTWQYTRACQLLKKYNFKLYAIGGDTLGISKTLNT